MKNTNKTIMLLMLVLSAFSAEARLDQFQANYVDRYYSNGWPREYSSYLYEFEAYDFMRSNAASFVIDHFGTEYFTSDNLVYLISESTGNFKGSNELTHWYSHEVYHSGFTKPLERVKEDPASCTWAGWNQGQVDGGYLYGGSVYFYGPYDFMVNFAENYFINKNSPDILHAWKNNCWVDDEHFAIFIIPAVSVVKLHNDGK